MSIFQPTNVRAELLRLDKYSRQLSNGKYETLEQATDRVIEHQAWLWNRQLKRPFHLSEKQELEDLKTSILKREQSSSGRTNFLGGTPLSKLVELTQFNCAFIEIKSVRDVVDFYWCLLNGCGVGAKMSLGLTGFKRKLNLKVIRTKRKNKGGHEKNIETWDSFNKIWRITIGDSAEAWAKGIGKILAHPYPAKKLIIDLSQIRPAGIILSKYGWISSGDQQLTNAITSIVEILNRKSTQFLSKIDVMDVLNWLGTTLSSRRSAEIMLMDAEDGESGDFIIAKNNNDLYHRHQSNNSIIFNSKPEYSQIQRIMNTMLSKGEPGIINGQNAKKKGFWFQGLNPCGETILMSKSFCNLWEVNLSAFSNIDDFKKSLYLAARANYRQTLVDFDDGTLQEEWKRNNEFLRLCGLGLTGIQSSSLAKKMSSKDLLDLKYFVRQTIKDFCSDLGTIMAQAITLIKPSGTLSKSYFNGVSEGIHYYTGQYMFNNINISKDNPVLNDLKKCNFEVFDNPYNTESAIVKLPVDNSKNYTPMPDAITQLENYKRFFNYWCDHNVSNTISFRKEEINDIINWMDRNWDSYLSATFLPAQDGFKNKTEFSYLPQENIDKKSFNNYVAKLKPVNLGNFQKINLDVSDCEGGACPVN